MRIFIHPNPLRYFLLSVTIAIVTFGLIFSSCTDYEQESVPVPDRTAVIYLNFKTGVLNVNKQVYDVLGQLQISTPKTKNSVRKIVLPPAVVAVLR